MKTFVKNNINQIIGIRTTTGLDHKLLNELIVAYDKVPNNDWGWFAKWLGGCQK